MSEGPFDEDSEAASPDDDWIGATEEESSDSWLLWHDAKLISRVADALVAGDDTGFMRLFVARRLEGLQ